ncbi:MAG: hypothetical protein B6D46_09270 [Polyangiaceae bacterium UTPRO1]|jgi:hypothetical protein|nr:hypothetical protein [Myxococcales bacterium]OQY66640.1 MAG: hypothetical protein B6D46_09270 [Polyangiaceae bacterium UTPRO1]
MPRRSLVIVVVVAVAAALLAFFGRRAPAPLPPPPATGTPRPSVETAPAATRAPAVVRTETSLEPVDESKLTAEQAAAAAARYRKAARFPRTSRSLEDGLDPIARGRWPAVDLDGDEKHPEPRLLAYPSLPSFEAPGEIVIYAEIVELRKVRADAAEGRSGREQLRRFRNAARAVRGVIQTMDGAMVAPLAFHDDGTHGDAQANDDQWVAVYTPDPDAPNDFRGQYRVLVQAESARGETLNATTSFVYSVQTAHLTGRYRDAVVDGNLQIDAEVDVEEAGRFRIEGTLVTTADAKMIGYAFADAELPPGAHWVPLVYYGLMFHDMKAPGPYSLFSVMLSTLGGSVPQESDVVPNAYTTKAYAIDEFGDQPFNDPEYMQKADHYDGVRRAKSGK